MSIPNKQIGWSNESNLLWQIAKQLERLTGVTSKISSGSQVPYKLYVATISQTGNNDPVATVLENTLGYDISWTRVAQGDYRGAAPGLFTDPSKVAFNFYNGQNPFVYSGENGVNEIYINTFITLYVNPPIQEDGVLYNAYLEIRVYP